MTRLVTFALAILMLASLTTPILLAVQGAWALLARGLAVFLGGYLLATAAEHLAARLRRYAGLLRHRHPGGAAGRATALASGSLPIGILIAYVVAAIHNLLDGFALPNWLFAYGVAAGPWTLLAGRSRLAPTTLIGVHAYAGHLLFLILSLGARGVSPGGAATVVLAAMVCLPPVTVGTLAALAGPDALPRPAR